METKKTETYFLPAASAVLDGVVGFHLYLLANAEARVGRGIVVGNGVSGGCLCIIGLVFLVALFIATVAVVIRRSLATEETAT